MVPVDPPAESDLHAYLGILWRRRWTVVLVTLVALVAVGAYVGARPHRYQATAEILLQPQVPDALLQANGNDGQAQVNVPTQLAVMESSAVSSIVHRSLPAAPAVHATEVGATEAADLSVTAADPGLAARSANAYADAYLSFERQQTAAVLSRAATALQQRLTSVEGDIQRYQLEIAQPTLDPKIASSLDGEVAALQVQAGQLSDQIKTYQYLASAPAGESGRVLSTATAASAGSAVHAGRDAVLALVIGLVLGVAAALLREAFARDASELARRRSSLPPAVRRAAPAAAVADRPATRVRSDVGSGTAS